MKNITYKKSLIIWFVILCIILSNIDIYSQNLVTIGTGNINNTATSYPAPYGNFYWGARHQLLIKASEIIAAGGYAGVIKSLAFDVATVEGTALQGFAIKLGTTSLNSISNWVSGLTTVYSVSSYTETIGWNTHNFTNNFVWNGTDNLIIEVCFNNTSYTDNAIVNQSSTSYLSCIVYEDDASSICIGAFTPSAYYQRPNIKLNFLPEFSLDASISTINSPSAPVNPGQNIVSATLSNTGIDTITSVNIGWSVNGIIQSPINWTGTLLSSSSTNPIILDTFMFTQGTHTIKVWSSLPNNLTDSNAVNDTATTTLQFIYQNIVVTLGSGTINNTSMSYPAPYGNYYWGARHQMLIPASEIIASGGYAGTINALGFDVATIEGTALQSFEIKLGTTSLSALNSWQSGLSSVYFQSSYTETSGWNTHNFASNFTWNGTDNLVVEVCFNNSSYSSNAIVNQSSTTYSSCIVYEDDAMGVCSSTATPSTYYQRPNIRLTFPPIVPLDAGVMEISNPVVPAEPDTHNVIVRIKNFGSDTLISATINWSVNGVSQTPYSWTGMLAQDDTSAFITLGSYIFPQGSNSIMAWTSSPNNSTDLFNSNDTAQISMQFLPRMNGVYSIGGTLPDYATFSLAVSDLLLRGINGPVIFNVANGTYSEQIEISQVLGISDTNTITFQSLSGDSSTVILTYSPISLADNYTIYINGASHLRFENISIKSTGTIYGDAVRIINQAGDIIFSNNKIQTSANPGNDASACNILTSSECIFQNNNVIGGTYGFSIKGNGNNNKILNNEISNFFYTGVYCEYQDSIYISGNSIENTIISGTYLNGINCNNCNYPQILNNQIDIKSNLATYVYGIYLYNNNKPSITSNVINTKTKSNSSVIYLWDVSMGGLIAKNKLSNSSYLSFDGTVCDLIYLDGVNLVGTQKLNIYNNFFSNTGDSTDMLTAIYTTYSHHFNIDYNSVNIVGGGSSGWSGGFVFDNAGTNIAIRNNIVYNQNPSYAINFTSTSIGFTSDYNVFYSTGNYLAYYGNGKSTLSQWVQATQTDSNSISVMPDFVSFLDLHLTNNNCLIDNKAVPISYILTDIDDSLRSTTMPTPGAVEIDLNLPLSPVAQNDTICYGETTPFLTASGELNSQFYWYSDSMLTTLVDSGASLNTGKSLPGVYTYYVVQINQCQSPATKVSLIISSLPTVSLSNIPALCNDTNQITLNNGNPIGGTYSGTGVSGNIFNLITAGVGTHNLIYSYTDSLGCNNSDTTSITVNPLPLSVISPGGPTSFCPGHSVTLFANTGLGVTYQWFHNGDSILSAIDTSLVVNTTGSYTVEVKNIYNCIKLSQIEAISVDSLATPSICILTVDSVSKKNMIIWERPNASNIDSFKVYKETTQSNVYAHIGSTTYAASAKLVDMSSNPAQLAARYKISAVDTCGNETDLSDSHKTVHLSINSGASGWNLIWTHYEGFNFLTYKIYRGLDSTNLVLIDSIQSTLTTYNDANPPNDTMFYMIEVVKDIGCYPDSIFSKANSNYNSSRSNVANSMALIPPDTTGIHETVRNNLGVNIYPNPNKGKFIISSSSVTLRKISIKVVNLLGELVYEENDIEVDDKLEKEIDLSTMPKGLYFVQLINEEVNIVRKVIVQ